MLLKKSQEWAVHQGDCIPHMHEMPPSCVDFAVFSPPFPSVFAYSDSAADLGNSEDLPTEGKLHFSFFFKGLARVLKPGRACVVHCAQIAKSKRSGGVGLYDFRGLLIRLAQRAGLVYEYDWSVRKNPQAQAIRTRKWELKFQGLEADRAQSRGALCDYLIKFRAPGENAEPVNSRGDVHRNDWIAWAECTWDGQETDTLNYRDAKGEEDTKHICPLQLWLIERLVRLYTNPGEIVFSPFAGIGSEGYVAIGGPSPSTRRGILNAPRRFYGVEMKDEYFRELKKNLSLAVKLRKQESRTLFDGIDEPDQAEAV